MYRQFVQRINRQPRQLLILLLCIAGFVLVLLMLASGDRIQARPAVVQQLASVSSMPLKAQPFYLEQRQILAQVEAVQLANLGFELSGSITAILVEEGQWVEAGQKLATLDTQRLEAEWQQLTAVLARRQAEAELAQLTTARIANLAANKLASAQGLDESRLAAAAASAAVSETEASLARLTVELNKSSLYAPFSGMLQARLSNVGSVVAPGEPLFRLQHTGTLRARMALSSVDSQALKVGQTLMLQSAAGDVPAEVTAILENKRTDTRTRDVLLALTQPPAALVAGDTLSYQLARRVNSNGAWVPRSAVIAGSRGLWQLMTLQPYQENHQVHSLQVNIEYTTGEQVFVSGVFTDGSLIAISGLHKIQPLQQVSILPAELSSMQQGD